MNFLKTQSICLALVLSALCPAFGAEPVSWTLRSEAQVDGAGIFLDQVALLNPSNALPRIRLADAPKPGQTLSLSSAKIVALVPGLVLTNGSGAAQVAVSRRSRSLDAAEITQLITATLQKEVIQNKGELELVLTRPWVSILVPDEPLALKITDLPASGIGPSFIVRFELWCGQEHLGDWQLASQCHVWREIPIAHATLPRGELLADADVTMERRDLLLQRDAYLDFPVTDLSLELVETIRPGMPVLNRSIKVRPAIRRGELVDGVFQDGALSISLKVQALEDGALGQTVRVRNPKSKRELYGKVQNETTILIAL